jgi:hypothetical protein
VSACNGNSQNLEQAATLGLGKEKVSDMRKLWQGKSLRHEKALAEMQAVHRKREMAGIMAGNVADNAQPFFRM